MPVKGKRLYYVYDFGDTWEHVIYRMSDPAADAVPTCENTSGTWGVDDVGGTWALESLVKALRKWGDKDCTDAECREGEMSGDKRFWYGWGILSYILHWSLKHITDSKELTGARSFR